MSSTNKPESHEVLDSHRTDDQNTTFEKQNELPSLPVPDLTETCTKFIEWVKPLLEADEMEETGNAVETFLEAGDGAKLQKAIFDWSCRDGICNWLEPFWYDHYLKDRSALEINSNIFYMFENHLPEGTVSQSERAAEIIAGALLFKEELDNQKLCPDMEKDCPLCMSQFSRMFSATRIPGKGTDIFRTSCSVEDPSPIAAEHIVVIRNGHLFRLQVMGRDGYIKKKEPIVSALEYIIPLSDVPLPDGESVGILTSINRDEWASARSKMIGLSEVNKNNLTVIEDSLFVVCLDDSWPSDRNEASAVMLHGDGRNRWFDKSLEFIICKDGTAAINMEHSSIDGSSIVTLTGFISRSEIHKHNVEGNCSEDMKVEELDFLLDDELHRELEKACKWFDAFAADTSVRVLDFKDFGKDVIKTFGLSPDGFVQMALQLSVFKLYGKPLMTYEPIGTRRFLHGRTEAMRTVSPESVRFTTLMVENNVEPSEKTAALREAVRKHISRGRECKNGYGVDRHLLGLKNIYYRFGRELGIEKLPDIFNSPGYKTLCRNRLSTSTSGHAGLSLCGFGPVVDDGFGVRYLTRPDQLNFNISARTGMTKELELFWEYLQSSLIEMGELMKNERSDRNN